MTDDQYKAAAYEFCRLAGLNPEEAVAAPSPCANGVMLMVHRIQPQWMKVASRLREFDMMQQALDSARK